MIQKTLKPQHLQKGETIGIIAPAGQLSDKELFAQGLNILSEMGFELKFPRELWPGNNYLADSDQNRAHELNTFFKDPEIKGIICLRGGYGCLRILKSIDLDLVAANPKFIVGFSDISILLNFLSKRTGLISLHGPVVTDLPSATSDTLERLFRSLTGQVLGPIEVDDLEIINDGPNVCAPVTGGNLSSLVTLLGTWADYNWNGTIVFLEEINEPLYKVDRMLTQLEMAGKFKDVAGIILGDFSLKSNHDPIERLRYRESVWNMVLRLCGSRNIPIWGNFPAGHTPQNITFPIGVPGEMNKDRGQLFFHLP